MSHDPSHLTAPRAKKPAAKHSAAPSRRVRPPRLYVYFDAIIRHGSIRSAAKALRIASSALNRRVGGQVGVGAAESAAVDMVPGAVAAFQREHPGVRFTVAVGTPRTMLSDLLDDRVDMILTHERPDHPDVVILAAAPKCFCALMHPAHPLAAHPRLQLRDCQDYLIVLADNALAGRSLIETTLAKSSLQFAPVLITPELSKASLMLATRRGRVLPPGGASFCEKLRGLLQETATL